MQPLRSLTSHLAVIERDNIDTDQIIPARFLKTTQRTGLGKHLFADWRYSADATERPEFPLNHPEAAKARILLVGDNFGCGSSREHAPWALIDFGFRVIVSTSFADIFCNNALKNGLLPLVIDPQTHVQLFSLVGEDADTELTIDVEAQVLILPDGRSVAFPLDAFSKKCLIEGVDPLGFLLSHELRVSSHENENPPRVNTTLPVTLEGRI